jgi:hypothetical protein
MTETVAVILAMLAQDPQQAPDAMQGFDSGMGTPSLGVIIEHPWQVLPGFDFSVPTTSSSSSS